MESLGFFEESVARSTSWSAAPTEESHSAGTRPDPFETWENTAVQKRLVTGRIRWSSVVGVLMMCAGIAGIAAWIQQRPIELAQDALNEVMVAAATLEPALLDLDGVTPMLTSESGSARVAPAVIAVEEAARGLFEASIGLNSSQSTARALAERAVNDALAASRMTGESAAFHAAVAPILAPPSLMTDPSLVELDEAAREFGEWQTHFDAVRLALADSVMSRTTVELAVISGDLPSTLSNYLDALRTDDLARATAVLDDLTLRLRAAGEVMATEAVEVETRTSQLIDDALTSVRALLG